MWMNFLIRTYAWLTIFEDTGLINSFLNRIGLPSIQFLYNDFAVVMGMLYNFLPFMILPIYSVLVKIDKKTIEAAQDLGANSFKVFTTITHLKASPIRVPWCLCQQLQPLYRNSWELEKLFNRQFN